MKNKKAQINLGNAPNIILIVGLTFLLMATIAYIAFEYQSGIGGTTISASETLSDLASNPIQKLNTPVANPENVTCVINSVIDSQLGTTINPTYYSVNNCEIAYIP
jgi:hypothetical protein